MPVGIHRLPTFGRNLQTALTELICPADFYSLPSLVEVVTAALFEHGAYPKGLPILVETIRRL